MSLPSEPIGQTCPQINRALKSIKQSFDNIEYYNNRIERYSEDQDAVANAENIKSEASSLHSFIIDQLEDLRVSNDKLRSWGQDLYSKATEYEIDISKLEDRISELEEEVSELKSQS